MEEMCGAAILWKDACDFLEDNGLSDSYLPPDNITLEQYAEKMRQSGECRHANSVLSCDGIYSSTALATTSLWMMPG